ncbi:Peroxide stress-activated histidine kinase mak2 [Daldinia childiae]|uniref:Peroxide stress-activated histidine kinase mak2 n=1 Tax=Daldinia childiae TaxID=326645 RepID=UPI0014478097|nr:Peroxide stress-activated histidine kinase mak2 [Daldinia childiae]KAF3059451.1 Peroxide stress-activated histidine kinase mak2 [Daldinia childiae]
MNRGPRFTRASDSQGKEAPDSSKDSMRRIFTQASQLLCQQARATGCVFTDAASGLFFGQSEGVMSPPNGTDPTASSDVNFESTEDEEADADKEGEDDSSPGHGSTLSQIAFGDRLDEMADVLGSDGDGSPQGMIKRKNLKKFIMRYPFGKCFYLNKGRIVSHHSMTLDEVVVGGGSNYTALNTSTQDIEDQPHMLLPRELLSSIPNAKWLIFLPLFNYAQGQWFAAGFIWGDDFKMGDPDDALPYFKTFGSCMMSEVASMEVLNTNIAKSTFIASISHDLRSPLHGMLGSLEFLEDTMTSAYQTSLIGAIETCGKTLLDTIDHLLDYAKINNLNRASARLSSPKERRIWKGSRDVGEPLSTNFDLALLLEEVVEAVFAGQTFRKINLRQHDPVDEASAEIKSMSIDDTSTTEEQVHSGSVKFSGKVFLILHIQRLASWHLQGQTGGLRRVIMNVVGNAIKYCRTGSIDVSLEAKEITPSNYEVDLSVKDTGIGMSKNFLANHIFKPFSQEDSFTPGTGLGLSITSQIVRNMDGKIKIDSEKGVGTHVNITIPMKTADASGSCGGVQDDIQREVMKVTAGKKVCILDPLLGTHINGELPKLELSISSICREWFNMDVIESRTVDTDPDTAIYIYAEPPPIELLVRQHIKRKEMGYTGKEAALLIVCTNAFEAAALRAAGVKDLISLGRIVEVISQPVGVRKLGKVLLQCLQRVEESLKHQDELARSRAPSPSPESSRNRGYSSETGWNASAVVYDQTEGRYRPSIEALKWKSDQQQLKLPLDQSIQAGFLHPGTISNPSASATIPHGRSRSGNHIRRLPRVLLVDDNTINLKLLVTFMKKIKLPYAEAMNGLEAVTQFKETKEPFDFVLMDLQMPVMDGLEATRQIREFEQERAGELTAAPPSTIIAITGVGNEATRQEAMDAGMSQFLTKPVKFKALQQILLEQDQPS